MVLVDPVGDSGIKYRCSCGAESPWVRVNRLMDVPGWDIRYVVVNGETVAVYKCTACNTRNTESERHEESKPRKAPKAKKSNKDQGDLF